MKIICVKCQCELRPEVNGTLVVEMASFGPYKIWKADTWRCPGCGYEVTTGFGAAPIMHHGDEHFQEDLDLEKETARKVVYDYERPHPR